MKKRGGAPRKAPGGLHQVLFVRAGADLVGALDRLLAEERRKHPGRSISRSDLIREILYRAVTK